MHRSLAIVFLGLALIAAGMVTADAAPTGQGKIGFINVRALFATPAGKRASAKLEKSLKVKQTEFDKKAKDVEKFQTEFEKQRAMLKPEVAAQRAQELQKRAMELQSLYMKLQSDLANEEAQLLQEVFKQAEPVIKQVAQDQGYSLIVKSDALAWATDGFDITAEVTKRIK